MKLTKPFLFVSIILLGCASCKNKAGTIEQENTELGTEEINDSVHQAQGHSHGCYHEWVYNGYLEKGHLIYKYNGSEYSLGKRTINRRYIRGFIHGHRR